MYQIINPIIPQPIISSISTSPYYPPFGNVMVQQEIRNQITSLNMLERQMEIGRMQLKQLQQLLPFQSLSMYPVRDNPEQCFLETIDQVQYQRLPDGGYLCLVPGCLEKLRSRFSLKRHTKKHTGEKHHTCPFQGCNKKFPESSTLKRHIRIHTGEKPFNCRFVNCNKAFADATNVKRHEMTHTGEKPYPCPIEKCTRRFSRGSNLKQHMVSTHNISGNSPIVMASIRKANCHRHVEVEEPLIDPEKGTEATISQADIKDVKVVQTNLNNESDSNDSLKRLPLLGDPRPSAFTVVSSPPSRTPITVKK